MEYLKDPEGLIGYVEEKVKLGNICLYCNGKGKTFHTYRALQQVRAETRFFCMPRVFFSFKQLFDSPGEGQDFVPFGLYTGDRRLEAQVPVDH